MRKRDQRWFLIFIIEKAMAILKLKKFLTNIFILATPKSRHMSMQMELINITPIDGAVRKF